MGFGITKELIELYNTMSKEDQVDLLFSTFESHLMSHYKQEKYSKSILSEIKKTAMESV